MLNNVIYVNTGLLTIALIIYFVKIRSVVKNGDRDRIRASLFLRYDRFKRTILFIIDAMTFVFIVQVVNMLYGLQYLTTFYYQIMIIASLISLIVIGYSFVHLNQIVMIQKYSLMRNELERWIYDDNQE